MKGIKRCLLTSILVIFLLCNVLTVFAEEGNSDNARRDLNNYYTNLKIVYEINEENIKKMDKIYSNAMNYIANTSMTQAELDSYVANIESTLNALATKTQQPSTVKEFLMLSNEVPVLSAGYGQQTAVVLSLINLGNRDIKDVVITPNVSNSKKEWPFVIEQAYDARCIQIMQSADNEVEAYNKRMDVGWNFVVREDALTGFYPLTFTATYYIDNTLETAEITTYINIKGKTGSGTLGEEDEGKSTPRIIVTGFTTNPDTVYAGSVFNLTVSVKNTSKTMTVKNVLFDLVATVEGNDTTASYAAFLPTSGSSSIYVESIGPGQTYDMSIEMEVKADLAQKPYVLTVNMEYEDEDYTSYVDEAKVSVPIKQESKMDTSSAEVLPESIAVGEQSNVMFSVYNTGKTTLYNVKVTYEGESIESGVTYLGNLTTGNTGNVDSMITGKAQDMGDGTITAVITYEDETGAETRLEKPINLLVYEMTYDDVPMPDEMMDMEDTQTKKLPAAVIIAIVAAAVIVVAVIVVVIVKKRKAKKKKEAEMLEDEDDI